MANYTVTNDDYLNTTGHTEDTEELVDGLTETLSIFNDVVEEDVFGVTFVNDEYHLGGNTDLNGKIQLLQQMSDLTELMAANESKAEDEPATISVEETVTDNTSTGRTSKNTIDAAIGLANATDKFGKFIMNGSKCSVCGKTVRFMPPNGYCSVECATKALAKRLLSCVSGEYETETPDIIKKVQNILSEINLVINVITKLPDIIAGTASFPDEYKAYATAKINIVFLEIKKVLNMLLIKKNKLIIKLLRRIKFGVIDDKLKPAFAVINLILTMALQLKEKLEMALQVAYNAINSVSGMFYIGPQEYGMFWTMKSSMAPCLQYKTDPTVYPSSLLGRPYWGGPTMCIAFNMQACQFSSSVGAKSALLNVDFTKINNIIRKIFLPITAPEYLMPPDTFKIRYAFSELNAPTILKIVKLLEMLVVIGGDFVPTYANLKLTNIWFVLAILMCWGPTTRSIFGDFIFHGVL